MNEKLNNKRQQNSRGDAHHHVTMYVLFKIAGRLQA